MRHGSQQSKGVKSALILGVLWAIGIAILWTIFRGETEPGGMANFLGRFHPLIVHLPIGIILLAVAMQLAGAVLKIGGLQGAMPFILWVAFLSAIASTLIGYLLMGAESTAGKAMDWHLWSGLGVVVLSMLALVFFLKGKKPLYILSLYAAALSTGIAGHFGGVMVHEADYLAEHAPNALKPLLGGSAVAAVAAADGEPAATEGSTDAPEETPLEEQLVYASFVAPILDNKCNECHNPNKIKGKLRMDTHEMLMKGSEGSDFATVDLDSPDDSELLVRVLLPTDDDEFMPPKGDALTPEEIELIRLWITKGATQELKVADLGDEPKVMETVAAVAKASGDGEAAADVWAPEWDSLSDEEKQTRLNTVQEEAKKYNFSIMPLSAEDDRLRVNVINAASEFGDEQLATLDPVAEHIAWLDLARSQVTDEGMRVVGHMRNLERLHLENTKVGDEGIAQLAALSKLEYLNLYGTQVGNGIFETFKSMPALRKIYLWQTKAEAASARQFERSVNLEINTGVDLEAAAAAAKAEKEAADAAAKKAEEEKKAAEAKKKADEEAKKKAAADAAAKKKAAEDAAKKKAAEDKKKQEAAAKAAAAKKAADEAAKKKAAEDAAKKQPAPAPKPQN